MTIETVRRALGWCTIINIGLLLLWWLFFLLAPDFVRRVHGYWFKIPAETFGLINYAGMGLYKMGVFMFNLVPYVALRIIENASRRFDRV